MSQNDARGAKPGDSLDWNDAWNAVARLAAARAAALREMGWSEDASPAPTGIAPAASRQLTSSTPIDPDQLARAFGEIEQASAALRQAEPALELGRPGPDTGGEPRKPRSIWFLIGGIWISTMLVCAGAIRGIFYVFG